MEISMKTYIKNSRYKSISGDIFTNIYQLLSLILNVDAYNQR